MRTLTHALLLGTIGLTVGCQVALPSRPPAELELWSRAAGPKPTVTTNVVAPAGDFAFQNDGDAQRLMPLGVGVAASPGMFLLAGSMDFPVDENLTAGPALHFGGDENTSMFAPFGQVRYWLPIDADDERPPVKPFVQGGIGVVYMDKENRSSDWGLLLNAGAGIRVLTGKDYRIASTMLFNFVPGDVAGESAYFTWEVISVVVDF